MYKIVVRFSQLLTRWLSSLEHECESKLPCVSKCKKERCISISKRKPLTRFVYKGSLGGGGGREVRKVRGEAGWEERERG